MSPLRYSFHVLLVGTIFLITTHQNHFALKASQTNLADTVPTVAVNDTTVFEKPEIEASIDKVQWRQYLEKKLIDLVKTVTRKGMPDGKYRVMTRFIVEKDGSLTDITVLNDPGYGVGKELQKIIKTSPLQWTPASSNGSPVRSYHTQPVTFILAQNR